MIGSRGTRGPNFNTIITCYPVARGFFIFEFILKEGTGGPNFNTT
jgi:hypothetical protein